MKLVPVLLLQVALVTAAVVVYHQAAGGGDAPEDAQHPHADTTGLEARIAALEEAEPVALRSAGASPSLLRRVEALEARLAELEARPAEAAATADESPTATARTSTDDITPEEIERARKVMEAARVKERAVKMRARVVEALAKAEVRLTPVQQKKVAAALARFMPRRNEIWGEVKTRHGSDPNADWDSIIVETGTRIQREFQEVIAPIVSSGDAEAVAVALLPHGK